MALVVAFSLLRLHRQPSEPTIGCIIYRRDDVYMNYLKQSIIATAKDKAQLLIVNSNGSQSMQNQQIEELLQEGVRTLMINPVDRSAAGAELEKAKKADVPVVFFNKEPYPEDMKKWPEKVYYVGSKAETSGMMSGQILADYWKNNPKADLNGDGKLQYVMLKGETGHQDTELRSKYVIRCLRGNGIAVQKVAEGSAYWERNEGRILMSSFLTSVGDRIEAVIANNDEMALGAIEALKAAGFFKEGKYLPVISVDATPPALQAIEEGTLLGTVFNDSTSQGKAAFNLAYLLAQGIHPTSKAIGYTITDDCYVWIPYQSVDRKNFKAFLEKRKVN